MVVKRLNQNSENLTISHPTTFRGPGLITGKSLGNGNHHRRGADAIKIIPGAQFGRFRYHDGCDRRCRRLRVQPSDQLIP